MSKYILKRLIKNPNKAPCFIVAEMSGNHNGKLSNAIKLVKAAKKSGANAVKIQLYSPDYLTINSNKKDFLINSKNSWSNYKNLYNLYKKAQTPISWYSKISKECNKHNLILFSSVFDLKTVDFLSKKKCPIYKIASPEITDIPLIEKVAKLKKPVILSSGLATIKDLQLAIKTLRRNFQNKIILLKCTSAYPAPTEELNLTTMQDYKKRFKLITGFSDHTKGSSAALTAVALGAKVIEKHIVLNKKIKTVDSFFSSDPQDFKKMVLGIREVEKAIGKISYKISKSSIKNLPGRKSIYAVKKIKKNEKFTKDNIRCVRPSFGLHPKYFNTLLGKKSNKNLTPGDRITFKMLR